MLLVRFLFWHDPSCPPATVRKAEVDVRMAINKCFIIQAHQRIEVAGYPQMGKPSPMIFGQVTYEKEAARRNANAKPSCNRAIGMAMEKIFGYGYVKIAEVHNEHIVYENAAASEPREQSQARA